MENLILTPEQKKKILSVYTYGRTEAENLKEFVSDAKRWCKSIASGSMLCVVKSVAKSGMSRVFYYTAFADYGYRQFYSLLMATGHSMTGDYGSIRVSGCGMDMNFYTNYCLIHKFFKMGLLSQQECDELSQKTPSIV